MKEHGKAHDAAVQMYSTVITPRRAVEEVGMKSRRGLHTHLTEAFPRNAPAVVSVWGPLCVQHNGTALAPAKGDAMFPPSHSCEREGGRHLSSSSERSTFRHKCRVRPQHSWAAISPIWEHKSLTLLAKEKDRSAVFKDRKLRESWVQLLSHAAVSSLRLRSA